MQTIHFKFAELESGAREPARECSVEMASDSKDAFDDIDLQRRSGIPPQGRLGAARNELLALALGLAVMAAIAVSFWISAR